MPETGAAVAAWVGEYGATAATVAAAGASVYSATRKPPSMPGAPPALQQPNGAVAANAAATRARAAGGLSGTNVTGPQGLLDPATTAAKSLLGG